jgi:hypothetical protein
MEGRTDPFAVSATHKRITSGAVAVTMRTNSQPLLPPAIGRQQIMNKSHEKSAQEAHRASSTSVEADEVLAAMEQTVEAAGALGAEIERAKRLLRETEKLVDPPVLSDPDQASNASTDIGRR